MAELLDKLGIEISVSDFKRSLKFYTEVLNFEVQVIREEGLFAHLTRAGGELSINGYPETTWEILKLGKVEFPRGRGVTFRLEVINLPEIVRKLQLFGINPLREPEEVATVSAAQCNVTKVVEFLDPDGYCWSITQDSGTHSVI